MSLPLGASKQRRTIGLNVEDEVIRHTRRSSSPYLELVGERSCPFKLIKLPLKLIELPLNTLTHTHTHTHEKTFKMT